MHYSAILFATSAAAVALQPRDDINIGNGNSNCPSGWTFNQNNGGLNMSWCCPGSTNVNDGQVTCCVSDTTADIFSNDQPNCLADVPVTASDYSQRVSSALGTAAPTDSSAATSVAASQTATITIAPITIPAITAAGRTIAPTTIPGKTITGTAVGGNANGQTIVSGAGNTVLANPAAAPSSSSTAMAAPAATGMGALAAGAVVAAGMIFA